jgi:hypothetical protein
VITKRLIDQTSILDSMPRKPSYDCEDLIRRARDILWKQGWAWHVTQESGNNVALKGQLYAAFVSDALYQLALDNMRWMVRRLWRHLNTRTALLALQALRAMLSKIKQRQHGHAWPVTFLNYRPMATCLRRSRQRASTRMEHCFAGPVWCKAQAQNQTASVTTSHGLCAICAQSNLLDCASLAEAHENAQRHHNFFLSR